MLTYLEITAMQERVRARNIWLNMGGDTCSHVRDIDDGSVTLTDGAIVPLSNLTMANFVVLQPCDAAAAGRDNLALLQDAEQCGLVVNYRTGDVALPPHLLPKH
jgi:hypothetical protein